jgi:hypothetical protein
MRKTSFALLLFVLVSSCALNNVKNDDELKKYFDEFHVDGSFAVV